MTIYVHIPFCESKCAYCVFASFVCGDAEKNEYVKALCKEIKARKTQEVVSSIYFGGGTPSVLSEKQLQTIFECIQKNYNISCDTETTIEANPNSVTKDKLAFWKRLGFNRVSVGVQSLSDENLRKIGRLHTKEQALVAVKEAAQIFENVSCDLLVGLQGENGDVLCNHAEQLLISGAKHVSCYLLEVYPNSNLAKMIGTGLFTPLSDDEMIDAFESLCRFLSERGFERYEISNFAKNGFESRHNLNYWARGEYLGFGLSAHSFEKNVRTENAKTFEEYYKNITKSEILTREEENEEKIMLSLRCRLGLDVSTLTGYDITKNSNYIEYLKKGILVENEGRIHLDPRFYDVSNTIISNLFEK